VIASCLTDGGRSNQVGGLKHQQKEVAADEGSCPPITPIIPKGKPRHKKAAAARGSRIRSWPECFAARAALLVLVGHAFGGAGRAESAPIPVWPQFRGVHGLGIAEAAHPPLYFGPSSNVLWQAAVPRGHSSPCIWGDHLFLTAFEEGSLQALDFDRRSGALRWRRETVPEKIERGHPNGSPATSTPTTDGERVYVYFGSHGLTAYGFDGATIWDKPLPAPVTQHGASSSPILAGGKLILACDQDVGSYLLALDPRTGATIWRAERPEFRRSFSTPLAFPPERPTQLVLAGTLRLVAYDLESGREEWRTGGIPNELCATPVTDGNLIFAGGWTMGSGVPRMPLFDDVLASLDKDHDGRISRAEATLGLAQMHFPYIDANKDGFITREEWESLARIFDQSQNCLLAVRPGGKGEIGEDRIVWRQKRGLPYVPSPLAYRGRVYLVKNGGLASCLEASTGQADYLEERLGALGDYYASPIAAGDYLYAVSQRGDVVVWREGPRLDVVAVNRLGETVMATPALVEETLYLRTEERIFAFRELSGRK
jgi:outer membrane protein assembly factor BamB